MIDGSRMRGNMLPEIIIETPELQSKNVRGQIKYWQAYGIKKDDGKCYYYTLCWHQLENSETSARTTSELNQVVGKNRGRSNETSDEEQLIFEVGVLERKKREEGYHVEGEEPTLVLSLPMLAYKYPKEGSKLRFPCYAQPKLDGFRCVTNSELFWTRKGKLYPSDVVSQFSFDTNGLIPDGELMLPPDYPFEQVKSATAKFNKELTPLLQYHIFDCVPDGEQMSFDMTFEHRYKYYMEMLKQAKNTGILPDNVFPVKCTIVNNVEEAETLLMKSLRLGYEGIMLRNIDGIYSINHRSRDLLKFKFLDTVGGMIGFEDAEFEVVGCKDGRGRESGAIIYTCVTSDGTKFDVRPEGTIEERRMLYTGFIHERLFPVGHKLTVRYQNLSKYGVPRFPVGIAFRSEDHT
jgi:DNA ligase-1